MSPLAFPKSGVTPKQARARRRARQLAAEIAIKAQVRIRDGHRCRACYTRACQSVHEIKPKGMGGSRTAVSLENSIAVCGDGVLGCHGFLQRYEIRVSQRGKVNANRELIFTPNTKAARVWMFGSSYANESIQRVS